MDVYKNVDCVKNVPYDKYLLYNKGIYSLLDKVPKLKISDVFEPRSRPIMLNCETINTCTNNCIVCAYGMMKRDKIIMPIKRFEKVLRDYSDMGGGYLSLTPRGEIFLDSFLVNRVSLFDKYPRIKGVSVTTNAVPMNYLSDEDLRKVLNSFVRIHISIYGLDSKEYNLMTQRNYYSRMVENIKKISEIVDKNKTAICFGFRLLKEHSEKDIRNWIKKNFERDDIPYGCTYSYTNWRGALNDQLPLEGKWQKRVQGKSHCLMPLIEGAVYSNGDVTYCPCTEFDIIEEFKLGNIDSQSLSDIFNSNKNQELWNNLPKACLNCSFYSPIAQPSQLMSAFQDPLSFIGG